MCFRKSEVSFERISVCNVIENLAKHGIHCQSCSYTNSEPGRVVQSIGHLTRKSGVLGSITGLATYSVSPSAFPRRAVVSYWRKYVYEVLVNRLGGLRLPRIWLVGCIVVLRPR